WRWRRTSPWKFIL
ncbi:glutathione S-transferase, N-terminal domain protein, partial [Vibrio parahaemolyticus AQ3810]